MLVQQAVPGVVLISDTRRQLTQGCDRKGGMQLPTEVQERVAQQSQHGLVLATQIIFQASQNYSRKRGP